jgi:import inner membrane translocase subunit TIM8
MDKLLEDPQLAQFVQQMEQEQRLKKQSEKLTLECWDLCVPNPNISRFDYKTEQCLVYCVDRYIDTSQYLIKAFGNKAQSMAREAGEGGFEDGGMTFDEKFSDTKQEEKKKSSSWW